jgi:hypothetical protein
MQYKIGRTLTKIKNKEKTASTDGLLLPQLPMLSNMHFIPKNRLSIKILLLSAPIDIS